MTHMCALASSAVDSYCIMPWYRRVPSLSDLADLPSRNVQHELLPLSLRSSHESVKDVVEECLQFAGKAWSHFGDGWGPWPKSGRHDCPICQVKSIQRDLKINLKI